MLGTTTMARCSAGIPWEKSMRGSIFGRTILRAKRFVSETPAEDAATRAATTSTQRRGPSSPECFASAARPPAARPETTPTGPR